MSKSIDPRERARSHGEAGTAEFYAEALKASEQFRNEYQGRLNVVKANQMPLERSPQGLIKHIINERMNTKDWNNCAYSLAGFFRKKFST